MDPTRFDTLTKRLAAGTSRRRLLTGLGSAVAGALALHGGARAAIPCEEALRTCLARADDAYAAAVQACRFGQPDQDTYCLIFATGTHASAVQACQAQSQGCVGTCKLDGEFCSGNTECCSGRCGVLYADPRPVFGCV